MLRAASTTDSPVTPPAPRVSVAEMLGTDLDAPSGGNVYRGSKYADVLGDRYIFAEHVLQ